MRDRENNQFSRKGQGMGKSPKVLLLSVVLALLAGAGVLFGFLRDRGREEVPSTTLPALAETPSYFEVHFIDVGQGDAALILCDGKAMLIDGGESAASSKIYTYLKAHGVDTLQYVVATHPDADHIGGLSAALSYARAEHVFCSVSRDDSRVFGNLLKYTEKQGLIVEVPKAGENFPLGSAAVEVLGPLRTYDKDNNNSLVLRVTYGETSFLFMGDAETEAEQELAASGKKLRADVLKVSHHGSGSGTGEELLKAVKPACAVISVGKNNAYGHPKDAVLDRLSDAGVTVCRTDEQGTLVFTSDGKTVSCTAERESAAAGRSVEETGPTEWIGNIKSQKYHRADCSSLPAEQNRIYFDSEEEALRAGYTPCGHCLPERKKE